MSPLSWEESQSYRCGSVGFVCEEEQMEEEWIPEPPTFKVEEVHEYQEVQMEEFDKEVQSAEPMDTEEPCIQQAADSADATRDTVRKSYYPLGDFGPYQKNDVFFQFFDDF